VIARLGRVPRGPIPGWVEIPLYLYRPSTIPNCNMPSSIEHALVTLVPSLNSLPQELTSLAGSLLAQSRARATNLKPDEEIGRTYACAHIACDRYDSMSQTSLYVDCLSRSPSSLSDYRMHAYCFPALNSDSASKSCSPIHHVHLECTRSSTTS